MKTKQERQAHFDRLASERPAWIARNRAYHRDVAAQVGFVVPPDSSVLELGCGVGDLLASLQPRRGLGIDFSPEMVRIARQRHPVERQPGLEFRVADAEALDLGETFDYVVLSDLLGELTDIWAAFRSLRAVTHPRSRVFISSFNSLWEPVLRLGEALGLKTPQDHQNWLSMGDIANLLELNGFEVVTRGRRLLFPKAVPVLSTVLNRYLAKLPLVRNLCLCVDLVARPRAEPPVESPGPTVTVVIPCRNERGNIRAAVERTPAMGARTELLFVDGNSNDGTVEEVERVIEEFHGRRDVKLLHQVPRGSDDGRGHGKMLKLGKGDAVRKGFEAASGEVLMILDSDLTVPPEELPKFYQALVERRGELINGNRLVYPMERDAMRFLNKLANRFFGALFTWLCGQRLRDTLCGTKVLYKADYRKIVAGRAFFGDFDPFGDFDLLFGATKQNLRIVEVPVRYRERTYGEVKIERFRHGLLLLRMSAIALVKLKLR
jgi:glycosyltransferase involved in cell wall biosynthesis/ubiquinone/menaquinone biosynthesis C-methylase UbiE